MPDVCSVQVDYVEPSQNTISLKMIPRIDLDRIKAKMSLVGAACAAALRLEGAGGSLTPLSAHRKTGSPRGRSSRGLVRGCLTQRRSGTPTSAADHVISPTPLIGDLRWQVSGRGGEP